MTAAEKKLHEDARVCRNWAQDVCNANDFKNSKIFYDAIQCRDPSDVRQEIITLKSELKAGEHEGADNLAAILTSRIARHPRIK